MLGKIICGCLVSCGAAILATSIAGCSKSSKATDGDKKSVAEQMVEKSRPPIEERERIDELKIELDADVRTNTQGWPTDINLSAKEQGRDRRKDFGDDRAYLLSGWKQLQILNLADTQITDKSLEELNDNTKLRQVILARTKITNAGLTHLKKNRGIYWLDVSGTGITNEGLIHIGKFENLTRLDLTDTKVTANGIVTHLRSMPKLQKVLLSRGQISDAEFRELRKVMKDTTFF